MRTDLTEIRRRHMRHLRRSARITTEQWRRKLACWAAAVVVGVVAVGFAMAADAAATVRNHIIAISPWIMLALTPAGLALSTWLTRTWFRGAQGSGIPQTIATLHLENFAIIDRLLSLRVAAGKIVLTTLGLMAGGSIGREGPSVQIGAAIMHACGRWLNLSTVSMRRGLILAGGASGVSAAFNTPLAGIVFAIEELSHSFEQRTSGTMLTGVILSGVTAIALVGNYSYFGHTDVVVPIGISWIAVPTCGILGGIGGGVFSAILIRATRGLPGGLGRFARGRPVAFAATCGLLLAVIGIASDGITYGTGYEQAHEIIEGKTHYPASFFILKFIATIISYCSGIPGGLFAPSLAIGAGFGGWVAQFLPHTTPGAVVLLGTVAYFSAVVQSPLTASVIVMEMCDNQQVTLALLATSFLAYGVSRMICSQPLYAALAEAFLDGMATAPRAPVPAPPPAPPLPAPAAR